MLRIGDRVRHKYHGEHQVIATGIRLSRNPADVEQQLSVRVQAKDKLPWDAWLSYLDLIMPATVVLPEGV
jgi:hypothetical protein